ncbi:MAG: acyl-CoA reductase, partial [Ruminococcus flavefaciens]|nr:acyl-CoA reductase [Ruminococcus flavefaciens]
PVVDEKFQTLLYFGIEKKELIEMIVKNHLTGIDRVVPIGNALDIDVIWDGYDIIAVLSRKLGC